MKKSKEQRDKIRELKTEFASLYQMVFVTECFGTKDLMRMEQIGQELFDLNYYVVEETKLSIRKNRF